MSIEEIENRFTIDNLLKIENRFKEVTGLQHLDLSIPHFERGNDQQQKTTKEEYNKFGFVCTPLWLVDEMIEIEIDKLDLTKITCDVCSGCGQFSIRLLRKLYNKYPNMDIEHWLAHKHVFTEFQFTNVAKLIYIFGTNITVYAGDTRNITYARQNESGILYFKESDKRWHNLTDNYINLIEQNEDNLDILIKILTSIEKQVMPPPTPKKVKKQKEKPQKQPKVKVQKQSTPTPVIPKQPVPPKTKVKSTPAPQSKKQKFVEVQVEMKIGGKYNPKIDFDDF